MTSRRAPSVCIAALCCTKSRILCVRRAKDPRAGAWTLPGGHLEFGERGADGVVRELLEETGAVGTSARFLGVHEYIDGDHHLAILVYQVDITSHDQLTAGDDALDVSWVPPADLTEKTATLDLIVDAMNWACRDPNAPNHA